MPQYDPDPYILEERVYALAQHMALVEWDPELTTTISDLRELREHIRSTLLEGFPDIEGPRLANVMDEALHDVRFPLGDI